MIKEAIFVAIICSLSSRAFATPYGNYDLHKIFKVDQESQNHHVEVNFTSLLQLNDDLSRHADTYPPQFDCDSDKIRAANDVKAASDILAILNNGEPNTNIMLIAAHLNALAHNFDIPFAAEKANAIYTQLTKEHPDNAHYAYSYGLFLESSNQLDKASIYLNQALSGGVFEANRSLGMLYLMKKDNEKALNYLRTYQSKIPDDKQTAEVIQDIEDGNVTYKHY